MPGNVPAKLTALCAVLAMMLAGMSGPAASDAVVNQGGTSSKHAKGPTAPKGSGAHGHAAADRTAAAGGHEGAEGLSLVSAKQESVEQGSSCRKEAPMRSYRIAAVNVDVTLNRYLDHDPNGRMYVLESDFDRVRKEEERNRRARREGGEPAVTLGLQGDAIQPLTLRVNQGECLRIRLRNALKGTEPAGLHLHDSELMVAGGGAAIAGNPKATVRPGESVTYEWMVDSGEQEATHYFHSHARFRKQTSHGLFGAVIVEPAGSAHLDPSTGKPRSTGWDAIIRTRNGSDFREFALYYHEIGHENYRFLNGKDQSIPIVDPLTGAYRPGARAINYRSEPFSNRLSVQQSMMGRFDESVAYSSYVFGDPATPIARSYLADPVKQRVIHAGSEVAHVHHVHGGAIRWPRQPGAERPRFDSGPQKRPGLTPTASERIDSQTISPSETFDVEHECGSGGCQASAGDFLIHCHIAHHYFAGMWGLWRVYNTLQGSSFDATDQMPPLAELPDRRGALDSAVTSAELIGKTVDFGANKVKVDPGTLKDIVEVQLPPQGAQRGYDASVLDWTKQGDVYLGEPDSAEAWPGFRSASPGQRPPLRFDPATGKLAYPFLRPHLGKRPPFPPAHNPAPFLDPAARGPGPPEPGSGGSNSVCPAGTKVKEFKIQAISTPVRLNAKANLTDPDGELYVLKEQEEAIRADPAMRIPLAIRANAREDCVDVILRSELEDSELNHGFSKVNLHIHLLQFDIQASDGVIAGFNYEQSVRPFAVEGEKLVGSTVAEATSVVLSDAGRFQPGVLVGIGMDQSDTFEVRKIASVQGATVSFDQPLEHPHSAGEYVSTEFVRSRWYPDVQFGTAYFHDHVNAVASWKHGLFGALIAEPPGASYHDPLTGESLRSGPLADIHSRKRLSADIHGSFREMVLFIQDDSPLTHIGRSTGGTLNLRVEPLAGRKGKPPGVFNSNVHGDPETPILQAYPGDPLVIRSLVAGTNEVHTVHIDGHWFRTEPYSETSPWAQTAHLGISERFDLMIPSAGGPRGRPGDYMYRSGRPLKLAEGNWGLIRVHDRTTRADLRPLPGRSEPGASGGLCPGGAPRKQFQIAAVDADIPGFSDEARMFVMASGDPKPGKSVQPLVLRVNSGDCIEISVANKTSDDLAFHADMLAYDPLKAPAPVGRNPARPLGPGKSGRYSFFADPEIGETVAMIRDMGDPLDGSRRGLYGAIVVGPAGARYRDSLSTAQRSSVTGLSVEVQPSDGPAYRDFTVFMHDEDASIGTHKMPYIQRPEGVSAISYGNRNASGSKTPIMEAVAGERVKINVISAFSEQAQAFFLEGHRWKVEPGLHGSDEISSVTLGGLEAITIEPLGGAGGLTHAPGDYLYGNHRAPYTEAGMWGLLRVHSRGSTGRLQGLPANCEAPGLQVEDCAARPWPAMVGGAALVGFGLLVWMLRKRRSTRPGLSGG